MAKVGRIQVGRYFDFVSCLVLSFLSAASLANRSSLSRAVFARTAWPAATYSDMAFAPSVACCAFWVFLNWASASVRSFECLAMVSSALVFGDLVEDRLPRLLLLVNEGGGLGGRHRIGVAPQRRKLLLQFRVESHFAQVFADLVDDRLGRANGRHQNSPASGLETWNRFRHCGDIGEFRQTLGGCYRDQLDRTRSRRSRDA